MDRNRIINWFNFGICKGSAVLRLPFLLMWMSLLRKVLISNKMKNIGFYYIDNQPFSFRVRVKMFDYQSFCIFGVDS